jgi:hypothetical protein
LQFSHLSLLFLPQTGKLDDVLLQVEQLNAELEQHKAKAKEEAKRLRETLHNKVTQPLLFVWFYLSKLIFS